MKLKSILLVALFMGVFIGFSLLQAKQEPSPNPRIVNQSTGIQAGDQSNRPEDILTAKKIRSTLIKDQTLSSRAKNIMITVLNNGVTLKGEVNNADERAKILEHAYITAPKHRIYNQISVVK